MGASETARIQNSELQLSMGQMASYFRPVSNNLPSGSMAPPRYSLDLPTRQAAKDHAIRNGFERLKTVFARYDGVSKSLVPISQLFTRVISSSKSIITDVHLVRNGSTSPSPAVQIVRDMDTGSLRDIIPGDTCVSFSSYDLKRVAEGQCFQMSIKLVDGTSFLIQRDGHFSTGSYTVHRAQPYLPHGRYIYWASAWRQNDGSRILQKSSGYDACDVALHDDVETIFPLLLAIAIL
ncbi:hypothetical protein SCHPADRAFT_131283 [Schizopora paradoxa]|uniref:Uncharacterized protein n=1 Tax=Schizopora paradoxa TaxID=27342 RepID=A0A0H2S273_9AGAM|nr:hypothetical protein SCHPADRAFT_131283 [Schizopora paradoxa]